MEEEMPHQTYLQKYANGDYYYRRPVPDDIRDDVGLGSEYERSLKTKDSTVARERWKIVNAEVERLFAKYRNKQPAIGLSPGEALFPHLDGDHTSPEEKKMLMAAGHRVVFAKTKIRDLERMLTLDDYPFLELPETMLSSEEVRMLGNLKSIGFGPDAPVRFVRAFVQAELKALKYIHDRSQGVDDQPSQMKPGGVIRLSLAAEQWAEEKLALQQWKPRTAANFRSAMRLFVEIAGDRDLLAYSNEDIQDFKAKLLKLPPNIGKDRQLKGKAVEEIIELGLPPMRKSTALKILRSVGSFFKYAFDAFDAAERNPFAVQSTGKSKPE